ncbi:MAG: hypothetical protein ACLPUO_13550 [Streptosporangiaceae bacterium]
MTENSPGPIAGKTALVTGGIGRATAAGLAALGARVGITGRDEARTRAAADGIARESGSPRWTPSPPTELRPDGRHGLLTLGQLLGESTKPRAPAGPRPAPPAGPAPGRKPRRTVRLLATARRGIDAGGR